METREVPAGEWRSFFDQFSRLHKGKPVMVETMGKDLGVQPNARGLPLMGITAEGAGGAGEAGGGEPRIEVLVGDSTSAHLAHVIARPLHVRVAEWNDGYSAALQIETAEALTTLLRVGPEDEVLPPGLVTDGILSPGAPLGGRS